MKVIRITYVVQPEFAEHNLRNVQAVMADLEQSPINGIRYNAYRMISETACCAKQSAA
ncbi:MAG: hypothetical protein R2832_16655 [Rhodothermales bacterium]